MKTLKLLGTILICIAFTACQPKETSPPNILLCIADDVSFPHIGANGCNWVKTPAIDRIANEGLLFSRAYTPNAKCAPSRSTIVTGLYSWQLKEAGNHWCNFPSEYKTYAEALIENGYHVGFTGKGWAPGNTGIKNGKKRQLLGPAFSKKTLTPPTKHISKCDYAENFKDFYTAKPEGQPFCFWYGGNEPHRAYEFKTGETVGKKSTTEIKKVPDFWPDHDSVRHDMLDYALEIEHFDSHLEKILTFLEEKGELENTFILFTADNGMPFPRVKGQCYEYSNHLPMAVMWKNGIKNPGRVIEDYISFVDFAPTILELTGLTAEQAGMNPFPGKSLSPYFTHNSSKDKRDHVLICKERHDIGRPNDWGYPIRGIVQDSVLYVHNFEPTRWPAGNPSTGYLNCDGGATKSVLINGRKTEKIGKYWKLNLGLRPADEIYNIKNDPACIHNLMEQSDYSSIAKNLKSQMFEELKSLDDPRMYGNGDVFDNYPLANENFKNFYDKFQKGKHPKPRWIKESDFDPEAEEEESQQ